MTGDLPLMKNVLTLLANIVLIPLGLTAAASATNGRYYESRSLEESGLLTKEIIETIKNKRKNQKDEFFPMLLGTLAASILGNALSGRGVIKAGERTIRADQKF